MNMSSVKHISMEDIDKLINGMQCAAETEEQMLLMLQHLNRCQECLEKVKAHRRLDILLENWLPELHGEAYRKKVYLEQLEEKKKEAAGMSPAEHGAAGGHEHHHEHQHEEDDSGEADIEYYIVDEDGHEHPHMHTHKGSSDECGCGGDD